MNTFVALSTTPNSHGFPWEVVGFFAFCAFMLAFLMWAIYAKPEDHIDAQIKAALDYTRRQEETSNAIGGGK